MSAERDVWSAIIRYATTKKEYSNSQFFYFVLFYSHMLPDRLSKGEEVRLHIFNTYAKNMFVLNGEQLMWFRLFNYCLVCTSQTDCSCVSYIKSIWFLIFSLLDFLFLLQFSEAYCLWHIFSHKKTKVSYLT